MVLGPNNGGGHSPNSGAGASLAFAVVTIFGAAFAVYRKKDDDDSE